MSNIHTLKDLSDNISSNNNSSSSTNHDNSDPQHPPFNRYVNQTNPPHQNQIYQPPQPRQRRNLMNPLTSLARRQGDRFWSENNEARQGGIDRILSMFCCTGWISGGPCTDVRKRDYIYVLFSCNFWIIVSCCVYFIVQLIFGYPFFGFGDMEGKSHSILISLGAKSAEMIKVHKEIYRLLVPIFMHAGITHLFMNMFSILIFGFNVERSWGHLRYLIIFFGSGIVGNLTSCVVFYGVISVGASGAILGVIGATIGKTFVCFPKMSGAERVSAIFSVFLKLLFAGVLTFRSRTDWGGHVGGGFCGLMLAICLFSNIYRRKMVRILLSLTSLIVLSIYCIFMTVMLITIR